MKRKNKKKTINNDWRKTIRCNSCAGMYKAKLVTDRNFEASTCSDLTGGVTLVVSNNECPHCYALHTAEFSFS